MSSHACRACGKAIRKKKGPGRPPVYHKRCRPGSTKKSPKSSVKKSKKKSSASLGSSGMYHYYSKKENSDKIWGYRNLKGSRATTYYGRRGAKEYANHWNFDSAKEAKEYIKEMVEEKLRKGYKKVGRSYKWPKELGSYRRKSSKKRRNPFSPFPRHRKRRNS